MTRGLMDSAIFRMETDPVFADEVCRFQRLYPSKTVSEIAEHFGCDTNTGFRVIQAILSAPGMRRYRRGIEAGGPIQEGRSRARKSVA